MDDSALVREVLSMALGAMGHRVVPLGPSGTRALQDAVQLHTPDVVVLDLMLPAVSGDVLALSLAPRSQRRFKLLLCSNLDAHELERRVLAAGADGYVMKSAGFQAVAEAIVAAARA